MFPFEGCARVVAVYRRARGTRVHVQCGMRVLFCRFARLRISLVKTSLELIKFQELLISISA